MNALKQITILYFVLSATLAREITKRPIIFDKVISNLYEYTSSTLELGNELKMV